jgi:O-antigen/teichoic acid export membrane protein
MNVHIKLFSSFTLNFVTVLLAFGTSVILSRVLGPENFGKYRYLLLIASTVTLFSSYGLSSMLMLRLAQKIIRLRDFIASVLFCIMPVFLVVVSIAFYYLYHYESLQDKPLLLASLFYCLLYQLNITIQPAVFALDKLIKNYLFEVLKQSFFLLLTVLFYFSELINLPNIFWTLTIANSFSVIYVFILNIKNTPKENFKIIADKETLKNSFKIFFNSILNYLSSRVNLLILKRYVDFSEIGIYSLATTLVEKLWLLPDSICNVLYLELSNQRKDESFIATILRLLTIVFVVLGVLLAFSSFYFIPAVFSEKYNDSVIPFVILLPGVLFYCYSRIMSSYFHVKVLININIYAHLIVAILNLGLNFYLIPKYGMYGAATSTTIAFIVGAIYHLIMFVKISQIGYRDLLFVRKDDFLLVKSIFKRKKG